MSSKDPKMSKQGTAGKRKSLKNFKQFGGLKVVKAKKRL
jgi:hypothetical protein